MTKRVVFITGASRGLGAALATEIAQPDVQIVAVARTIGALEELDDRIRTKGGHVSIAVLDICSSESVAAVTQKIGARWGRMDLLIHAAICTPALAPVALGDQKEFIQAFHVNVVATESLIAHCQPLLKESPAGASAIFFDDPREGKFFAHYGSTKAAQIAIARSWQSECHRFGISVHIVEPKPMKTALRARFFPGENQELLAKPQEEACRILLSLKQRFPKKLSWLC